MKAIRLQRGGPIAPFGETPGAVPVGEGNLWDAQVEALEANGIELVSTPPDNEAYLVFGDQVWFTPDLVKQVMEGEPGRIQVLDSNFWQTTGPLQNVSAPGVYDMALHPGGQVPLEALPLRPIDLDLRELEVPPLHPQMAHAARPLRVGSALIHQVDHWTHVLRVNQLSLAATVEVGLNEWRSSNFIQRFWGLAGLVWRAKGWSENKILRGLSQIHPTAKIHPTAIIETSKVGPGVEVGPMSVIKSSILSEGARVEEHATIMMSCLGERVHVGRYAMVNLCTAWPGARLSHGAGYQNCLFGRDSFVAWGATILDLSFGRTVQVRRKGEWVDSGHHFLGAAIGHEACLGNGVRVQHGLDIPNGVTLVADRANLLREWPFEPESGAMYRVRDGQVLPLKKH